MYFFLANMIARFSYLEYSLIAILTFVGLKMLLHEVLEVPEWASLAFIALTLILGIVVSLKMNKEEHPKKK
jgi:tellurite resistance protein TerC